MILFLLLVQLVLCAVILHKQVVRLQFRNFATSIFFLVYAIVYVLEPFVLHLSFGGARSIVGVRPWFFTDPYVYYLYNAYGIALLVVFLLWDRPEDSTTVAPPPRAREDLDESNALAVLIVIGVVMFLYATGMSISDLLIASRFAWFGEGGFSIFWLTVSSYFVALLGTYAYMVTVSKKRNWWLLVLCIGAIVFHGVITKDRKWVIFLASGWFAGLYETSGRKLSISRRAMVSLAVLFMVLVVSQFIRDVIFRVAIGEDIVFVDEVKRWQSFLIEYGDISYFYRASLEAIHQNLNHGFLVPFALVRRLLFFFIPVGYSGGLKVPDISATFSDLVDGGDAMRSGNMPPGLFGLFVMSFGWFGSLFAIPLMAPALRWMDRLFRQGHSMFRQVFLAMYVFGVVLAFRGDESSAFYFVMSTAMMIWAIRFIRPAFVRQRPMSRSTDPNRPAGRTA